jgi:hypothetical protein
MAETTGRIILKSMELRILSAEVKIAVSLLHT